ncbi:MAG: LLM class flavin-dependent oxidoreductase [Streptosporangiaceae bacterium]|jgi:alkanesulfonate monooxygenase SsuD/methylene tetrahydromethanopterin reductase-like flavin-dependent oxidoreductase (luciferase family)
MKFVAATRITHLPDPITGTVMSTTDRLRDVIDSAVRAEELGFDGFGVEERHGRPFISSSPPVVLSHIAARTSAIRLFTALTAVSLRDPVRVYEDYATLDHLSGGRLELIIGEGSGTAPAKLSRVTAEDQGERDREGCELFRRLWHGDAQTWPRPLQQPPRIWHGSATSADSADRAARWGDPLFSANVTTPVETCAELVRYYRERWEFYRRDPGALLIGAGTAGYYSAPTSQQAIQTYRPIYNARQVRLRGLGLKPAFCSIEDAIERGSILVGSPQQIIDQVRRGHERLGHEVLHLHADAGGLTEAQHRRSQELFFGKIAPVLRREIPSRPFPQAPAPLSPVLAPLVAV